jgi:DNA-directed RNA polymerase II subunit RPB2
MNPNETENKEPPILIKKIGESNTEDNNAADIIEDLDEDLNEDLNEEKMEEQLKELENETKIENEKNNIDSKEFQEKMKEEIDKKLELQIKNTSDSKITWNIIDKYFNDNPNILIRHHLDSYNDFFDNKIYNIFKEKNPIRIMKDQDETSKEYNLQIEIYIGGKEGKKLYFGKPVIFDEYREHFMFPNEARLRNMTYGITLHVDVDIVYKIKKPNEEYEITESSLDKVYFGKFPIMLNSNLCILNGLSKNVKFNMGECKNDLGGYFIIDGKEKVLISQEKFADNMLYIKDDYNELYSHSAEIRSVSEDASKPIRTFSIRILRPSSKYTNNQILVNVPNVRKPVPLFILMRALGITSDKDIIKYCLLDIEKYENYMDLFIPCIHDAGFIFNQESALKYIATLTKGKTISHVLEILMDYMLPHLGENNFQNKAYYIGYMVFELLKVYKKEKKPTDRDSFKFKRVELAGSLLYDLFKEYYTLQQKHIYQKIDKEYYYKEGIYQNDFMGLIQNNHNEYFKERILEAGFKKAFKGSWGAEEHTRRPEVIQDLNRLSFNSFLSHLRKLNLPLDSSAKIIGPRLLHSSQWGIIDPVDTPDGGNVGLHKHISLGAHITSGYSGKLLLNLLRKAIFLEDLTETSTEYISKCTKIFLNGAWIGTVTKPNESLVLLKSYRRIGLIPIYTSISWSINDNIIYIYTDSGRLCRPVYYVQNKEPSYMKDKIINKLENNEFVFQQLLVGFNKFKEKADITSNLNEFIKSNLIFDSIGDLYNKDFKLEKLLDEGGILDYLDTSETETSLIANYEEDIVKYTSHLEIHPSLLLGIMGNQIVFPENNQLPRDLFSCGQSKQGVSVYNTNYQNRIDKMGVILNNGQVPLVKSRYLKYIYNEEHPYGINAVVAIGCYGGYNVEDSILFNEGSIKRGMFNTTYFNMYETYEESSKVASSTIDSKISNIENENVIGKKPGYDYSNLDENGVIIENTMLDDKKIVIGKVTNNINNPNNYLDASIGPKKGQLGFVDKAFITEGDEGYRIAKVRIREERIPAQGDKFCSRCGQKGTVGLIIPEQNMPFTDDGIRPDLIINPHALPSRMTIGQLVETIMGKACSLYGGFGDCTAFVNKGSKHEVFGKMLNSIGYNSTGNELLYNGETGEQLKMELFIGPCYYMRLKHMVKDKINYRAQGPRTVLTRQTVQGRANDGGLRIGEMERDCLISHGATRFLQESMLKRGDEYHVAVCNNTGAIAIYNESKKLFISPFADGPLKYNYNVDNSPHVENVTKFGRSFSIIRVPYAFKLLMQELQVMNIQMRIITEDNINQLTSMNFKNTIEVMKNYKLNETQKSELYKKEIEDLEKDKNIDNLKQKKDEDEDQDDNEEDNDDDDDEDEDKKLSKEAITKANENYDKFKDLEEDNISVDSDASENEEKPPLTIGERIGDSLSSFIQSLTPNKPNINEENKDDNKNKESMQYGNNFDNNEKSVQYQKDNFDNTKKSILEKTEEQENNDKPNDDSLENDNKSPPQNGGGLKSINFNL